MNDNNKKQNKHKNNNNQKEGSLRAREVAAQTLSEVRRAMKIDYFNDIDFINEQARRFKGE